MNERELQILVSMKDEFSQKMTGIEKALDKSVKEANKAQISFKKLAGALGGMATVYASLRFAMSSVAEYAELESTQLRLEKIVMNATGSTKEQVQALHEQASALEKLGVVDKQVIGSAQAKLATFDLSISAIKELTPALLDMAVAEYGVSVSSEQVTNLANGFGKALQGNTELLTKQGFKLSDYEIELLKNGDETQRLATMNEILGRTYGGVNEEMTKTVEGGMKKFQIQMNDIKETVGKEIAPSLLEMSEIIVNNLPAMIALFTALAKSMANVLTWVTKLAGVRLIDHTAQVEILNDEYLTLTDSMIKAGEAGDKETAKMFAIASKAKKAETEILSLTKAQEILAKYQGGNEMISKGDIVLLEGYGHLVDEFFSVETRQSAVQTELFAINTALIKNKDIIEENSEAQKKAMELLTKPPKTSGLPTILTEDDKKKMEKAREDLAKALEDFTGEYSKFGEKLEDQLFSLGEEHTSAVAKFKEQIKGLRNEVTALNNSFAKGESSDRMTMAEEIVSNEERIAEIQKELAGEVEKNKARELQKELDARLLAEQTNADFINQFATEIAEAKRVAGLTDLERSIEEYNSRRALATQEYNEKLASINAEIREVKKAQKEEARIYQEKTDFISEQLKSAEARHAQSMEANLLTTAKTVEKEIEYYKRLAVAIDAVRGSNTSGSLNRNLGKVEKVNDAIIAPNGNIISTHPDDYLIATKNPQSLGGGSLVINIQTMIGSREYAEEMGNEIIKTLALQAQI
jgi:hypothetical protein